MDNQKMPDGSCHGRDLPDRGTGYADNASGYGVGNGALDRGFTDRKGITGDTKSDGKQESR